MATKMWHTINSNNYSMEAVYYNPTYGGNVGPMLSIVPPEARYIAQCVYDDGCCYCGVRIPAGSPIWYTPPRRVWCGAHKQHDPAATVAGTTHKENDMAQRHDFTFPYTGSEIAAALEAQAAKLDEEVAAFAKLDQATLEVLYTAEADRRSVIEAHEKKADKLRKQAAALRTEARPYAKAGDQRFDLDLEDVEHFKLDAEDAAPAKPRRLRKSAAQKAEEATAAE